MAQYETASGDRIYCSVPIQIQEDNLRFYGVTKLYTASLSKQNITNLVHEHMLCDSKFELDL